MLTTEFVKRQIKKHPRTTAIIGSTLLLNASLWFEALVVFMSRVDSVPLHYTIYFGINRLGPPVQLFVIPIVASILFIINSIFSFFVSDTNRPLAILLLIFTLCWHALLLLSFSIMIYKYYGQFFSS